MGAFTPAILVAVTARAFTPAELCGMWDAATWCGDDDSATRYLDALAVHAMRASWGELIEGSMNGWKEVDVGAYQEHET